MRDNKPAPVVIHGWAVFAHPMFVAQIDALTRQVEAFKKKDARGYVKKNASVTDTISIATVKREYAKAFLDLNDLTGGAIQNVAQADWNTRV